MTKKILLFILTIFLSCGKNKYEEKLLGIWYTVQEGTKLEFYNDSLFISDIQYQKTLWNADNHKIKHKYKIFLSDSIVNMTLEYKLSKNRDSLFIVPNNDSLKEITLIKSKDYKEFLIKKNKIDFTLEKNENAEFFGLSKKFEIKIFFGYNKGKIIYKSEYSNNLKDIDTILKSHLAVYGNDLEYTYNDSPDSFKEKISYNNWLSKVLYYSVFVDKKIPKNILTKKIELLKSSNIKTVYQIYDTNELNRSNIENYIHFTNLKGIKK